MAGRHHPHLFHTSGGPELPGYAYRGVAGAFCGATSVVFCSVCAGTFSRTLPTTNNYYFYSSLHGYYYFSLHVSLWSFYTSPPSITRPPSYPFFFLSFLSFLFSKPRSLSITFDKSSVKQTRICIKATTTTTKKNPSLSGNKSTLSLL